MKSLVSGLALVAVCATPVLAETRYDKKLEEAVMKIVAARIGGELRGGFSYGQTPAFVLLPDTMATGSVSLEPTETASRKAGELGPVRAVERKVRVISF